MNQRQIIFCWSLLVFCWNAILCSIVKSWFVFTHPKQEFCKSEQKVNVNQNFCFSEHSGLCLLPLLPQQEFCKSEGKVSEKWWGGGDRKTRFNKRLLPLTSSCFYCGDSLVGFSFNRIAKIKGK